MAEQPSRSDRFTKARGKIAEAMAVFENLRDELQSWYDKMPENLQLGPKADELDTAIAALDEVVDACDTIAKCDVKFPGIF